MNERNNPFSAATWLRRSVAACIALLLAVPFGAAAATAPARPSLPGPQASTPAQPPNTAPAGSAHPAPLPNNPGATPPAAAPPQSSTAVPPAPQQQQNTTPPVGTAAAPYVKALGNPASRPAGAAIAPGKQKRARSFLIKVGIIVGAAIAVGTVIGLSKGSPSRPN